MKKILRQFFLSLCLALVLVPALALAVDSRDLLMGLGLSPELADRIYTTLIGVNSSGNIVIPVASSKKLSVTVAGTEKFSSSSTGLGTFAAGVTATTGDITATAGNFAATAGNLTFGAASAKIIPGATSLLIRNNADSASNIAIADAGDVTIRGQATSTGLNFPAANFETVAGAGTTVADAGALSATKHIHQLTGANGTVGWKFAAATAGQVEILLNTTAGVPKVYAVSGGTCNGGAADAACTLVTGIVAHVCYATATNAWICS